MIYIYPYAAGSQSVRLLKEALGARVIKLEGSRFNWERYIDKVVNWGNSHPPGVSDEGLNLKRDAVSTASNKLHTFEVFHEVDGINTPEWSTSKDNARAMIREGQVVVCRTILTGHSGIGIVIAEKEDELVHAPLYVQYLKKKNEFRIHVFRGKVIDRQRKARRTDVPDDQVNWKVRNLKGGFIYQRNDIKVPEDADEQSIKAVNALGLDFGAVDILHSSTDGKSYVLEVNTAPGLSGTTLNNYVRAIKEWEEETV